MNKRQYKKFVRKYYLKTYRAIRQEIYLFPDNIQPSFDIFIASDRWVVPGSLSRHYMWEHRGHIAINTND